MSLNSSTIPGSRRVGLRERRVSRTCPWGESGSMPGPSTPMIGQSTGWRTLACSSIDLVRIDSLFPTTVEPTDKAAAQNAGEGHRVATILILD